MPSDPLEIASTIQTASINRQPSHHHDINPSTAAEKTIPLEQENEHHDSLPSSPSAIPLRPRPRQPRPSLPPLPDLRFEQSYLASIPHGASYGRIGWITFRDQLLMPLLQGTLWTLGLAWWRNWNRSARLAGGGAGAKVRRWWWRVNHWQLPKDVLERPFVKASEVTEFYEAQLGAGGD